MQTTIGKVGTGVGAIFFGASGVWAFVAPRSFYDQVALWPPYNEHLMHDAGVFQLGIGVGLVAALIGIKGTLAVLAGAATAAVLHVVSHLIDYGEGGRSSDPFVLGAIALLLLVSLAAEWRSGRQ
jgi:hypothetical protein